MATMITNSDLVNRIATRREDHERFLAGVSRSVLRAEAVARFNDRTRAARAIRSEWAPVRRALIESAVGGLYRVLQHTEGDA